MVRILVIGIAAFLAGIINAIAGGGTLISFPALIWSGVDPVIANATSTVALLPGSLGGMLGFRRDLEGLPRWLWLLMIPSLIGGACGALILLHTSSRTFATLVPFLILGATLLMAAQNFITKRLAVLAREAHNPSRGWIIFAFTFQFLVGVYGGYFGGGIGILMLAALSMIGMSDLHQMNGLKNLLAIGVNGIAAIYFAVSGAVLWHDSLLMAVASIAGGLAGAKLAHHLGRSFVRGLVIAIGVTMATLLFVRMKL